MEGRKGFLASPRRRRRLAWGAGFLAAVALVAAVVVLDPGRNSKTGRVRPAVPEFGVTTTETPAFASTVSAAEERARERAEAAVRPLAATFVDAMLERRNFERAHALLAPRFRTGSVADWQRGRQLPLTFGRDDSRGSTTVAYSGATEVGVVVSIDKPGDSDGGLVALRFDKSGPWRIDYVHQGQASARIGADDYSPPGFLPGSHQETGWEWLILAAGLVGIIGVGRDRRLVALPHAEACGRLELEPSSFGRG